MKITVLTDSHGKIVGAMQATKGSPGAPTQLKMAAGKGQEVHEVDVPEAAMKESLAKLHGRTIQSLAK